MASIKNAHIVENWSFDDRYSESEYVYGENPNVYLESELNRLFPPGKILLPCEGEGRNAVFASSKGWIVTAFDLSVPGKKKAEKLANAKGVSFNYDIADMANVTYPEKSFDVIGFIFIHLPMDCRLKYYRRILNFLKPGGLVIFEAFGMKHIPYRIKNPFVGGPKDPDWLFTKENLDEIFKDFDVKFFNEQEVELNEGEFHKGLGSTFRILAKKKI